MKAFALVAIILLAVSAAFAESYQTEYTAGDWLKVTRISTTTGEPLCFDSTGVTDACANPGAIQPNQDTTASGTTVQLMVENVGQVDRNGVDLSEDIAYVPTGARIAFSSQPSSTDGRTVTWSIGTLAKGATQVFTYTISARIPPSTLSAIPDIAVSAEPALLSLSAPGSVKAGEKATITVQTPGGKPVSNAIVIVTYPDGIRHPLRTDSSGTVRFSANDEGTYTYSLDGYSVGNDVSTKAGPAAPSVPAAPVAAAVDTGIGAAIMGVIPVIAAIFAIAIIALILYNFFTSRREDEEYQPSQVPSQAGSGMNYSQNYAFGDNTREDRKMRERTADIIESRKKHLASAAAAAGTRAEEEEPGEAEAAPIESTATDEDMTQILSELEHKARVTGEVAHEEEEVARTISELEAIREKLRAMRAKGKGAALEGEEAEEPESSDMQESPEAGEEAAEDAPEADSAEEAEEPEITEEEIFGQEPAKKAAAKKPSPKKIVYEKRVEPKVKPVAKGKKMRFGNKGVKKR